MLLEPKFRINTLHPQFLQVHALTLFPGMVSASRADMFASEIGQAPPMRDSDVRRLLTGMERRFGEFTDMVKMPGNASVIKVITKRPPMGFHNNIPFEKTIIFQMVETGEYDSVTIPINSCNHQQFGFDYKRTETADTIRTGMNIAKDTILAHSPSLDGFGNYKFGINGKIAFLSINEIAQDGAVISESFAKRCAFKGYGSRTLSFGGDTIPLNLFGDDENYKIFPDIGERVPANGLMFATRKLKPGLEIVQLSTEAVRVREDSDKPIYAESHCQITGIEVVHNNQIRSTIPENMVTQCKKYQSIDTAYYQEIMQTYYQIKKECGAEPLLGFELYNLVREGNAMRHTRGSERSNINFVRSGNPLNEYTVTIHYSYDLVPSTVFKLADCFGGKAVIVEVWPDERMPVDARGTRAEVIMDGGSIVNRLNPARLMEQSLNGVLDTAWERVRNMMDNKQDPFPFILQLYRIMSPKFYDIVVKEARPEHHCRKIYKEGFYVWLPTDNPVDYVSVSDLLAEFCPPLIQPITYIDGQGKQITTERPVLIADQYFIMLEKIGDDYSAVASPVLQPQGIPGKITRADKYSSPGRPQAIRGIGETEMRILNTMTDPDMVSDLLDFANSPATHRYAVRQLLTHPTPTNIEEIVPRSIIPRGNNRITQHVANSIMAGGFEFEYRPIEE